MKNKLDKTFVRVGNLGPVKQKGFNSDDESMGMHKPPAIYGFYAMPFRFQEWFLIGSIDYFQPKIFGCLDDKNFKTPEGGFDWDKQSKLRAKLIRQHTHKFTVDVTDELWHHLTDRVPNNEILQRHGAWVKTTVKAWEKALRKECINLRIESGSGNVNNTRKRTGYYSKDHFEVFFDYKVV